MILNRTLLYYNKLSLQDDASDSDENIFNSPFIKKPHQPKVRHHSDNTTPLPEKEFSFISSNKDPKGNKSK